MYGILLSKCLKTGIQYQGLKLAPTTSGLCRLQQQPVSNQLSYQLNEELIIDWNIMELWASVDSFFSATPFAIMSDHTMDW